MRLGPAAPGADGAVVRGKTSRSSRINVNMMRHFSNQNPGAPSADADAPAAPPGPESDRHPDEPLDDEPLDDEPLDDEPLDDGRSQFTRRLESFGLGERQSPLLTDCVWSLDADGNLR
jgi:hypothetical protein